MVEHTAKYERHVFDDLYRVTCTCGWSHIAHKIEECETRFTSHDLPQWTEIEREPHWWRRLHEIKGGLT